MRVPEVLTDKIFTIADYYEIDNRIDMLIEEMSELTKALLKNRRARAGEIDTPVGHTVQDIEEEIADVEIMLQQIVYLGDFEEGVTGFMETKLDRQLKRISKEKEQK